MTGWRVGFVVACKEIMENIVKVHHTMNICACAVSQKAALAALTGPQDCVVEMVREYDERRKEIVNLLNEIPGFTCQMLKGAFYVFPNIKLFKTSSMEFAKFLIKDVGPGKIVNSVAVLGFFEIKTGGLIKVGDKVSIRGKVVGEIAGYNEVHMPNHMNILIKAEKKYTGLEMGLELGDKIVI